MRVKELWTRFTVPSRVSSARRRCWIGGLGLLLVAAIVSPSPAQSQDPTQYLEVGTPAPPAEPTPPRESEREAALQAEVTRLENELDAERSRADSLQSRLDDLRGKLTDSEAALLDARTPANITKLFVDLPDHSPMGTAMDTEEPEELYRRGYRFSRFGAGPRDDRESLYWLKQAALNGSRDAMHTIGIAYVQGLGVEPDLRLAFELLQMSAVFGSVPALFSLGVVVQDQTFGRMGREDACWFFQQAEKLGHPAAAARVADAC